MFTLHLVRRDNHKMAAISPNGFLWQLPIYSVNLFIPRHCTMTNCPKDIKKSLQTVKLCGLCQRILVRLLKCFFLTTYTAGKNIVIYIKETKMALMSHFRGYGLITDTGLNLCSILSSSSW